MNWYMEILFTRCNMLGASRYAMMKNTESVHWHYGFLGKKEKKMDFLGKKKKKKQDTQLEPSFPLWCSVSVNTTMESHLWRRCCEAVGVVWLGATRRKSASSLPERLRTGTRVDLYTGEGRSVCFNSPTTTKKCRKKCVTVFYFNLIQEKWLFVAKMLL